MYRTQTAPRRRFALPRLTVRGLLDWLIEADRAYRQKVHFDRLPEPMLRDIGLTRHQNGRISRY